MTPCFLLLFFNCLPQTRLEEVWRDLETLLHIIKDVDKAELVVDCGIDFKVSVPPATLRKRNLELGSDVCLLIKTRALHVLA
jgi:hypothetical protein